jgi:hypothetical protein
MIAHPSQFNLKMKFLQKQKLFYKGREIPSLNFSIVVMAAPAVFRKLLPTSCILGLRCEKSTKQMEWILSSKF